MYATADTVKETIYRGRTIKIITDDNPMHPHHDFDNVGKMICFHKRYDLGDKHGKAKEYLQGEVKSYDKYLTGQFVDYVIIGIDGEEEDSCWRIDDAEYAMQEAKDTIDASLKRKE